MVVQCSALGSEDGAIGGEQVLALHAGAARPGTDQHGEIGVGERGLQVVGGDHVGQQREGAVVQLHHHALQGLQRRGDFQQLQDHRLIGTQHAARSNPEGHGITDVASSTGDDDTDRLFHVCTPSGVGDDTNVA